jgi:hypothetical protein
MASLEFSSRSRTLAPFSPPAPVAHDDRRDGSMDAFARDRCARFSRAVAVLARA